ncbi:MAG TPA: glycosyltransferase family 2 protein [bacterium]|nr:glycosyltransferase family 2 protein [bacterium]
MRPKVLVIILNYGQPDDTTECVRSVQKSDYPNFDILVIDNASPDDSCERIEKEFPGILLMRNPVNLGYAGGNNAGIRFALEKGYDYVFILNNDAVVAATAIRKLVDSAETNPHATIVAPKVFFYDQPKIINSFGTQIDWFRLRSRVGDYGKEDSEALNQTVEREIIPGAALLIKKQLFEEVGLFNEEFFLIHEDADLCLRNIKKGFRNLLVPDAYVYHKISKTLSAYPFLSSYYSVRNMLYLSKRHASLWNRLKCRVGLSLLMLKKSFVLFINPREKEKIMGFFAGIKDYYLNRTGKCERAR